MKNNLLPIEGGDPRGRKAFYDYLRELFDSGSAEIIAVLHVDIDCFLAYNDHFGHESGNKILQRLWEVLCAAAAPLMLYRISGQAFTVAIPSCDVRRAKDLAEKMRLAVFNEHIPNYYPIKGIDQLTVSVGVSALPLKTFSSVEALISNAELATKTAKRNGRNQIYLLTQ